MNSYSYEVIKNSLKLTGKGRVEVKPNIAVVTLGVITENKSLKDAQKENAVVMNKVLQTIKSFGIESNDIQTSYYNVSPQYDYVEGKQIFKDYKVSNYVKITIKDMDITGQVIDAAVEAGANYVGSVNFTVQNESKYYNQALNLAIKDAIFKVKDIERNFGYRINEVPTNIIEKSENHVGYTENATLKYANGAVTPVNPGQIGITASVYATFVFMSY